MKRTDFCILVLLLVSGGVVLAEDRDDAPKPAEKTADAATLTHDTNGNVVISMTEKTRRDAGIMVTNGVAGQWNPEAIGYGRVLDPAPLAALVNEMSSDQAAYAASHQEYERLRALSEQNNASVRALENARAVALRDQLATQSVQDRLDLSWGNALAGETNLPAFIQTLITRRRVLLRIDLPAGQILDGPPREARVVTLSGQMSDAKFLGTAPAIDPQLQGQGFILSIEPNTLSLAFGQAVSGYLGIAGKPVGGVIVPREAVVRAEGAAWVYVMNGGGESFTRTEISLDRPTDRGWFVGSGITPRDSLVVVGAQTLLSQELKGALTPD